MNEAKEKFKLSIYNDKYIKALDLFRNHGDESWIRFLFSIIEMQNNRLGFYGDKLCDNRVLMDKSNAALFFTGSRWVRFGKFIPEQMEKE